MIYLQQNFAPLDTRIFVRVSLAGLDVLMSENVKSHYSKERWRYRLPNSHSHSDCADEALYTAEAFDLRRTKFTLEIDTKRTTVHYDYLSQFSDPDVSRYYSAPRSEIATKLNLIISDDHLMTLENDSRAAKTILRYPSNNTEVLVQLLAEPKYIEVCDNRLQARQEHPISQYLVV